MVLTSAGLERAAEVRRRHELLCRYLVEALGVPRDIAENDACRMEHVVSAEMIDRLREAMEQK